MDDILKDQDERAAKVPLSVGAAPPGEDEKVPIKSPLRVLDSRTVSKKFGWWAAVVLLESYAKKQICFYLWQKKGEGWKRKQKFGIHSKEDWHAIKSAVEVLIQRME